MVEFLSLSSVGWVDERKPNRLIARLDIIDVGFFNPTYDTGVIPAYEPVSIETMAPRVGM